MDMLKDVRMLCAGWCLIDRSEIVVGTPEGSMVRAPAWMHLLRGTDSLLLVDTGMPPELVGNPRFFADDDDDGHIVPQMTEDDRLERVLSRQGVRVQDLDAVISTHWHFDHAGSNRNLGNLPVYVHPDEVALYRGHDEIPLWVDLSLNFHNVQDGARPMPGVTVLHTPGHTPGHLSLLLEPAGGRPLILTIDATYTSQNWIEEVPGAMMDPDVGMKSVARLKDLAKETGARVFFGHDPDQAQEPFWKSLQG